MARQMKGITVCGDCAYYNMKKHRCTRGCVEEGDARARFYEDCPLPDVSPVVFCRHCVHYENGVCLKIYDDGAAAKEAWQKRNPDDFCSYGEKRKDKKINGE